MREMYVRYVYRAPATCFGYCGRIMLTNLSVLTHKGKETQLSFPHNSAAQTEGKECTAQIFTCCQPGFLSLSSLKHFFSRLCKILSFLCPAGKYHVITVVPKQDKEEAFKIGPQNFDPRFCALCSFTM